MRNAFAEALYEAAIEDERVGIVVADISPAGPMAKFQEECAERFINVGVAEQNMIGICAESVHSLVGIRWLCRWLLSWWRWR